MLNRKMISDIKSSKRVAFFLSGLLYIPLVANSWEMSPSGEEWLLPLVEAIIPNEPSESSHRSIGGVDSDSDQVRDDIENFIRYHYSGDDNKYTRNSLYNIAKFYSNFLLSDDLDLFTKYYKKNVYAPTKCLQYFLGKKEGNNVSNAIKAYSLTSIDRYKKYLRNTSEFSKQYNAAKHEIDHDFSQKGELNRLHVGYNTNCDITWNEIKDGNHVTMCKINQAYCSDAREWN